MTAVVYAGVKNPQFEGQTKGKLGNTEVRPVYEAVCLEQLSIYLDDLKHQEFAQPDRGEGGQGGKGARGGPQGSRRGAPKEASWRPRRWWASFLAARAVRPRKMSCSLWRAIPLAAAPSKGETGAFRRFCRCAASRSMRKRSGWIRCCSTRNSALLSPLWARAWARILTCPR